MDPNWDDTPDIEWRAFQADTMLILQRVHQKIVDRTAQAIDQEAVPRITPARANALMVLFQARRPINARELATQLGISEVTVSRFIRRMEEDGWVERTPDPKDARALLLRPTPQAREQLQPLIRIANSVMDDCFGGFGRDEMATLRRWIQRVHDNLSTDL